MPSPTSPTSPTSRRELVADAAVTVLSRDGLRGLTHRAVDTETALPAGSTSNCYRTRTALVEAAVARVEELDRAVLSSAPQPAGSSLRAVAASLAAGVELMTSRRHVRATRARLALLLDETAAPALDAGHQHLREQLELLLEQAGHPDPEPAARTVSDLLDGALVHAVSIPSRRVDVAELAAAVERLLRP